MFDDDIYLRQHIYYNCLGDLPSNPAKPVALDRRSLKTGYTKIMSEYLLCMHNLHRLTYNDCTSITEKILIYLVFRTMYKTRYKNTWLEDNNVLCSLLLISYIYIFIHWQFFEHCSAQNHRFIKHAFVVCYKCWTILHNFSRI